MEVICPVCETPALGEPRATEDASFCDCPNCGKYHISRTAYKCLDGPFSSRYSRLDEKARAVLSHEIWMRQGQDKPFEVQSLHLTAAENGSLPSPVDQLDSFIMFIGNSQGDSPGEKVLHKSADLRAKIGALNRNDVIFIDQQAEEEALLEKLAKNELCGGRLTLAGWKRYRELKRGKSHSDVAFMAMPFGNKEVTDMVETVFRPAVEETGFHLKRIDDETPTGLIDNRLRVEIGMCRFLIVDLTDENRGAYWEAGYAEGLGKPVIYTCSRTHFEKEKTHFDTNHQHTIVWDPAEPKKAAESLKATIRATLPFEARMPEE